MIISASRRTDIPAFFFDWFLNRLQTGFFLVRNPMNPTRVSRIAVSPETVDAIVFWTKNSEPAMANLSRLNNIPFYFQFTLTPYDTDIETNVPPKRKIIETFKRLADRIGPDRVLWRYDPILLNDRYTISFHTESFHR